MRTLIVSVLASSFVVLGAVRAGAPVPPVPGNGGMTATIGPVGNAPGVAGQVAYQVSWGDLPAGGPYNLEVKLVKVQVGANVVVDGPQIFGNIPDPGPNKTATSGNLFGPGPFYPSGTTVYIWAKIPGTNIEATSATFVVP